ncbi:hypothetical protein ACIBG6_07745 [Streptomyces sp. NPDC050842]|uniref:hypothetical protein n=1 Tax=Streptomyces sp. NPDC050842 TaxID=3365636 RepID=UPI0037A2B1B4
MDMQFRWSLGGRHVNAELPGPAGFAQAATYIRPEDEPDAIPEVGGDQQEPFLRWAHDELLLPALREP